MLEVSAAISRRVLPRLAQDVPVEGGLRQWLMTGAYYIDGKSTNETIVLTSVSLGQLTPYLAFDYERFALSSFESARYCGPEETRRKALGWPLLKIYYAAFFAAHAVLRATGHAVLRIDASYARQLTYIASAYDPNLRFASGSYSARIHQSSDLSFTLTLQRLNEAGAHEQLWQYFYKFLAELQNAVVESEEPNSTATVAEILAIQSQLSALGSGGGTWLSVLRNQINYQHLYGVWFPYDVSRRDAETFARIRRTPSSGIRLDSDPKAEPIVSFTSCCSVIAAINIEVSETLRKRPDVGRFQRLWNRLSSEA